MKKFELYKIIQDANTMDRISEISIEDKALEFDCYSISSQVKSMSFQVKENYKNNFLLLNSGCLVFDSDAKEVLEYSMELGGEIIPINTNLNDKELYLCNVLHCANILNFKNCVFEEVNGKTCIKEYAFKPDRIGMPISLFKLTDDSTHEIYCITGLSNEGFYEQYHKYNLKGLSFEWVRSFYKVNTGDPDFKLEELEGR